MNIIASLKKDRQKLIEAGLEDTYTFKRVDAALKFLNGDLSDTELKIIKGEQK